MSKIVHGTYTISNFPYPEVMQQERCVVCSGCRHIQESGELQELSSGVCNEHEGVYVQNLQDNKFSRLKV